MPLESMPPMAPTTMTSVGTFVPRPSRSGFSTLSMTPTKMAHARNGIAVDGGDPMAPDKTVVWRGGGGNLYANFTADASYLDVIPADPTAILKSFDAAAWFALTSEPADRSVGTVKFAGGAKPGFQTPATAFGADFVLALPGVKREDLA